MQIIDVVLVQADSVCVYIYQDFYIFFFFQVNTPLRHNINHIVNHGANKI